MGNADFLQDLVVVLVVAAVATILTYRLKQPMVLGYLLAGFLIGPFTPPFSLVKNLDSVAALAELGLIFLMFALGLEFNFAKLKKVGKVAVIVSIIEVALMISAGYYLGLMLGWTSMEAIFLGCMLSMSSTTIIVKVLMERGDIHEDFAEVAFGILIIEDLVAIVLIALLGGVGVTGTLSPAILGTVLFSILLFVGISLAVGLTLVPRLIDFVSRFQVEEVLVITVVGLASANALLALDFGFSLALGAFLMGAIIAESRAVKRVEHKILPIRDLFTAVFFVAVGMLIDPAVLWAYKWPILIIAGVTIFGKVIACAFGCLLAGYDGRTALRVGMSMGQIGEFSFIIAGLGLSLGVIGEFLYPVAVAVCAITTLLTPYFIRSAGPLTNFLARITPPPVARVGEAYRRFANGSNRRDPLQSQRPEENARYFRKAVLYAAWVVGLTLAAIVASQKLWDFTYPRNPMGADVAYAVACTVGAIVVLPAAVSFYRSLWAWGRGRVADQLLHPRLLSRRSRVASPARIRAHVMAVFGLLVLLGLAALAVVHVYGTTFPKAQWALGGVGAVLFLALVDHRRVERGCAYLERIVEHLLGEDLPDTSPDPLKPMREKYPLGVDSRAHTVAPASFAAYAALKSLDLRHRTGVHIYGIDRAGNFLTNPEGSTRLLPGDRIHLVGRGDQIQRAINILNGTVENDRAVQEPALELRIPPTSPLVGRPISHSTLQDHTGVRVVAHRRRDGSPVSSSWGSHYHPGDQILVTGTGDALERARAHMQARDMAYGAGPSANVPFNR